jgi:hypothetical protein
MRGIVKGEIRCPAQRHYFLAGFGTPNPNRVPRPVIGRGELRFPPLEPSKPAAPPVGDILQGRMGSPPPKAPRPTRRPAQSVNRIV